MPDWKKIKAEYIRGGVSLRKLAEKYSVSFSAIFRRSKKEKWTDLRMQSEEKANAKIVENVASQEAERTDMFNTIADKLLQQINDGIENGTIFVLNKYRDITGALKDLKEIKNNGNIPDKTIKVVMSPELEGLGR